MTTEVLSQMVEPIFARMARNNAFFCDKHFACFSRERLDGYMTYSENLACKWHGFVLNDRTGLIENESNIVVDMD